MRRLIFIVVALLMALLMMAGCSSQITGRAVNDDRIRIAVLAPYTGPMMRFGGFIDEGIGLALDELSDEARSNIEFVYEDEKCDPKEGINAMNKIVNHDEIKFILGPLCSNAVVSSSAIVQQSDVVSVVTGGIISTTRDLGRNSFAFLPEVKYLVDAMAEYVYDSGYRNVAVLYKNNDFGVEHYQLFKSKFEELGGSIIVADAHEQRDTDFRSSIIKAKDADAIYVVAIGSQLTEMVRQIRELQYEGFLFSIQSTEDPDAIGTLGSLADGIVYAYPTDSRQLPSQMAYVSKYRAKYGRNPEIYSANAYDSFKVLYSAIKKCDSDTECVRRQLFGLNNYAGATGLITMNERGRVDRPGSIKRVWNGSFEYVAFTRQSE